MLLVQQRETLVVCASPSLHSGFSWPFGIEINMELSVSLLAEHVQNVFYNSEVRSA